MTSPTPEGQRVAGEWRASEGMRLRNIEDGTTATIWWVSGMSAYVKFDDGRYGTYDTERIDDRLGDRMYICANFSPTTSGREGERGCE